MRPRVGGGDGAFGYNAATGGYGDMIAMGIIDPTRVTRLGLQDAASVAGLVVTADRVIVEAQRRGRAQADGPPLEP
jgi:chaperonin GroEL